MGKTRRGRWGMTFTCRRWATERTNPTLRSDQGTSGQQASAPKHIHPTHSKWWCIFMFVRSLFDPCRIWKLFSRHENWWHGFLTFARGNTHILPDWGLRWTPGNKARKLPWKIAGALGNPTLTQRDIFRQGSRRAHLPRRECSYGSFRGNPGFGCVKVSHDVSCFHYITTCPTTSPSPLCTHLFAHTFVCTYYIILMILFVYYCCFIDINIYIHIHMERDIHTHSFQFPGCLAPNIQTCHTFHRPSPTTAAAPSPNTTLNGLRWIRWSPTGPTWYCNNSRYNMTGGTTFKENTYIYICVCVHM